MQPIKQPCNFQPSCGVAESRQDNQTATLFPGMDGSALAHAPLLSRPSWITAGCCMFSAGAGARLPVDYLPPLPLYPGLVESEMADGQKLGGQGSLIHAAHQAAM